MNAPAFENLDLACAKVGKTIAERPSKELENLITSALAVLEEQGVYALFLYLKAQGKDIGQTISNNLHNFLKQTPQQSPLLSMDNKDIFAVLQKLGENLDNLLLARDLIRQSLVYARYHARVPKMGEVRT
ncbi:MAG: hypothetical protein DRH50_13900 [Deltaproteobacteria bacterium]|nr:MAG: hypothetical protein DRH50_13900 [Deltaproteobacteria bacterium]